MSISSSRGAYSAFSMQEDTARGSPNMHAPAIQEQASFNSCKHIRCSCERQSSLRFGPHSEAIQSLLEHSSSVVQPAIVGGAQRHCPDGSHVQCLRLGGLNGQRHSSRPSALQVHTCPWAVENSSSASHSSERPFAQWFAQFHRLFRQMHWRQPPSIANVSPSSQTGSSHERSLQIHVSSWQTHRLHPSSETR